MSVSPRIVFALSGVAVAGVVAVALASDHRGARLVASAGDAVVQGAAQAGFRVPGVGRVVDRVTILNALDRVNLIRPSEGIGIFQSAYGPRFTVLDSVSLAF